MPSHEMPTNKGVEYIAAVPPVIQSFLKNLHYFNCHYKSNTTRNFMQLEEDWSLGSTAIAQYYCAGRAG